LSDPLDSAALARALASAGSALVLDVRDVVGSTNDEAAAWLRSAASDAPPVAVLAALQTAGRGRQGAPWVGRRGASLALSIGWPSRRGPDAVAGLPLAVGVACAEGLAAAGVPAVQLKWPNDLLAGGAKLGGILVESRIVEGRMRVVVGVGINVLREAVATAALGRPVASVADLVAAPPSITALAAALLVAIERALREFDANGFAAFRDRWLALHAWAGRPVVASRDGRVILAGTAVGVDDDGAFLVETPGGIERIIAADVSLSIP
jgi:BirA family biotin operon repressor/biotin-[acetyl-CoA-carboxylase] ligase